MSTGAVKLGVILFSVFYYTNAYTGRVFDSSPKYDADDATLTMAENLKEFMHAIKQGENVVVFPEYGLTSMSVLSKENLLKFGMEIPDVSSNVNFCDQNSKYKILTDLSCAAKEYKIYLLANLIEVKESEFYNTNLVFNTTGSLIAKYRKIHLSDDESTYLTAGNETVSFKTEYGNFTTFTGADILYEFPALHALKNGVSDVLYPSAWSAKSPFWSSLSIQDGYVKTTGVNLLASSYNAPKSGNGGSGIYHGKEVKDIAIQAVSGITSLVANLDPADLERPECTITEPIEDAVDNRVLLDIAKLFVMKNALLDKASLKIYDLPRSDTEFQSEQCLSQLCCKFSARLMKPVIEVDPYYKFILYSNGGNLACGLVSCANNTIESCGVAKSTCKNNHFIDIRVEARHNNLMAYVIPSTLRYNFKPASSYEFCSKLGNVSIALREQDSMVAFGFIYSDGARISGVLAVTIISLFCTIFIAM